MKARNPKINFNASLPHWSDNHEFAQLTNGGSVTLPYLEPYLNKVMARASKELGHRPALQADIATFMEQEGHHYRQHRLFNKVLATRYPALAALEREMKADYDSFLANKSLKFNTAYCEGFECQGVIYGQFFFEGIDDLLAKSDPKVVRLWQWHLAEEFEHKTVCYDVYHALFGGYFMRIYGLLYAMKHLGGFTKRAAAIMLEEDRKCMDAAQLKASKAREKAFRKRQAAYMLPQMLKILSPFYNPRHRPQPMGTVEVLSEVDALA
jgi:predicted metal-dependent hydrolase